MACKRVILDSAKQDREEIVAYLVARTGSAHAASSFLADMDATVDSISEFPTMHAVSRMPELAERGYRVARVGTNPVPFPASLLGCESRGGNEPEGLFSWLIPPHLLVCAGEKL